MVAPFGLDVIVRSVCPAAVAARSKARRIAELSMSPLPSTCSRIWGRPLEAVLQKHDTPMVNAKSEPPRGILRTGADGEQRFRHARYHASPDLDPYVEHY